MEFCNVTSDERDNEHFYNFDSILFATSIPSSLEQKLLVKSNSFYPKATTLGFYLERLLHDKANSQLKM